MRQARAKRCKGGEHLMALSQGKRLEEVGRRQSGLNTTMTKILLMDRFFNLFLLSTTHVSAIASLITASYEVHTLIDGRGHGGVAMRKGI